MAQSGNRPPRRGQSARPEVVPPQAAPSGTGNGRATAGAGRDSAAERARERLAQRNARRPEEPDRGATGALRSRRQARGPRPRPPRRNEPGPDGPASSAADPRAAPRPCSPLSSGPSLVVVVVLVIVLVSVTGQQGPGRRPASASRPRRPASSSAVTRVSPSAFTIAGSTVTSSGPVPRGAHAAQAAARAQPRTASRSSSTWARTAARTAPPTRWPLAVALARFGTFKNLKITVRRGDSEPYPSTNTLSFYDSSYTSPYISFLAIEQCTDLVAPAADDSKRQWRPATATSRSRT